MTDTQETNEFDRVKYLENLLKISQEINEELKATYKKQRNKRIDQLQKENEELKEFAEKLSEQHADEWQKQQEVITELKEQISILLSCKDCPENKGGYICAKEYNDKCLAQKIQYIKELKAELAEYEDDGK